jgi:sortase A
MERDAGCNNRGVIRRIFRTLGVLMVAAGLAMVAWFAWQYWGTNIVAQQERQEILDDWTRTEAIGVLRVPRFGADYEVPILPGGDLVEQKGVDALSKGVAWYEPGARPGQVGNFVVGGHRVTHGEPFKDFPKLKTGDRIIVETRKATYTYTLRNGGTEIIVPFTVSWPLWDVPDPNKPDVKATEPVITLITCSELFHTDNRSVAIGDLTSTKDGEPAARPQVKRKTGFLTWFVGLIQGVIDFFQGR